MLYQTKGVIFSPVCRKRWKFQIHVTISGSYLNVKKKRQHGEIYQYCLRGVTLQPK